MNKEELNELGMMLGAGAVTGILFNIAIAGNPLDTGGIIGGFVVGLLMFILS